MSPLATWPISCAMTALTSSRSKRCNIPALTATRAALRFQPVANALAAFDGKIPTSGMPMPACVASALTVSSNQRSSWLCGCSMTVMPVPRFAIHFDRNSEISEPPKPKTAHITSSAPRFKSTPFSARMPCSPNKLKTILTSTSTAILVPKNSRILMSD